MREIKNMIDDTVRDRNWRYNHTTLNRNYSICKYSGLVLVKNCDCTGCNNRKRWEYIVGNIIGGLNQIRFDWHFVPQFKHHELRSGKGRNDFLRFDFSGFRGISFFEKNPESLMQNCAIEVNEKNHFIEEQDNLIFKMKTSDFFKWEFCLKNKIPLIYIDIPLFTDSQEINKETLEDICSFIKNKLILVEQFSRTTDFSNVYLETIDDFFIEHFTKLPGDKIVLDMDDFKENSHLQLEETCSNLTEYVNNGNLEDYVRNHYFSGIQKITGSIR